MVVMRHETEPIYLLYAHLDAELFSKEGEKIAKGSVFARVGKAPFNGNWFPHVHIQTLSAVHFEKLEKQGTWSDLDGYGAVSDIYSNALKFKDPMAYISLRG